MMDNEQINELVRSVKAGNTRDFSSLVREFSISVRAFIHSRVQNRTDAEDLAQQTFIAAFRGLDKFDTNQSFEAWLIGIAKNRVLMHFRTLSRRKSAHDKFREECLTRIEPELEKSGDRFNSERIAALMDCVERLPERMRRVIRARLRGEAGERIAKALGLTRGAIYMINLRANKNLKECLNQQLS